MKLAYKKRLMSGMVVASLITGAAVFANEKQLQAIEKLAELCPAALGIKCQQEALAERMKVLMNRVLEWGREWVNIKNNSSKRAFLIWFKELIDEMHAIIQELVLIANTNAAADKELKKAYNQTLAMLRGVHKNGTQVYTLIQQYNNAVDFTSLAAFGLKLRHYQAFLPKSVREMGPTPAFRALKHRFTCVDTTN